MITNSKIGFGDQLGGQMMSLAALYALSKEYDHKMVFWEELVDFRRGFPFLKVFRLDNIEIEKRPKSYKEKLFSRIHVFEKKDSFLGKIYRKVLKDLMDSLYYNCVIRKYSDYLSLAVDYKSNIALKSNACYDVSMVYRPYVSWKKYENEIKDWYKFKDEIIKTGDAVWKRMISSPQINVCSVHIRLTDYLQVASLNLNDEYYIEAIKKIPKDVDLFLIFSDDIEKCKSKSFLSEKKCIFVEGNAGPVDMYLMSKCKYNIIANSTFSYWGAFLNKNNNKIVVCPHDFLGESDKNSKMVNGFYYPNDWIAV